MIHSILAMNCHMHCTRRTKSTLPTSHLQGCNNSRPVYSTKQSRYKHHGRSNTIECSSSTSDTPSTSGSDGEITERAEPDIIVPEVGWLWDRSKKSETTPRLTLKQQNIRPKKALGQHFMLDDAILADVAKAATISPGDLVLEIGPGTGALTSHLLAAGAMVTAIEKDYGLHDSLAAEYADNPAMNLVCGDVMRQNIPEIITTMQQKYNSNARIKIIANLPYNITKEFLLATLPLNTHVDVLTLMVQEEVALRLTKCKPGDSDWRSMNVIVQYYCDAIYKFKVDKKKYTPPPQVDGAVVNFRLYGDGEKLSVVDEKYFLKVAKTSFLQRRKLLRNSLSVLFGGSETVGEALKAVGLPEDARAQTLGLEDYVRLSNALFELNKGG